MFKTPIARGLKVKLSRRPLDPLIIFEYYQFLKLLRFRGSLLTDNNMYQTTLDSLGFNFD